MPHICTMSYIGSSPHPPPEIKICSTAKGNGYLLSVRCNKKVARTRVGILVYSTRCCQVLLNRLRIGIMSLFQCGLPKETPILKNVLFCVFFVLKTSSTHPGTQTFSRLFLCKLLNITAPIPSTTRPVFCLQTFA